MMASRIPQLARIAFGVAILLLAIGLGLCNGLGRLDTVIRNGYAAIAPTKPVADVVVVTIGPDCVASVGRWPWPTEVYATLLERVSAQRPLAVGMDMVLSLPSADLPTGRHLAVALGNNATVLPGVFRAVLAGRDLNGEPSLDPSPATAWHGPDVENAASLVRHSLLAAGGGSDRWWEYLAVGVVDAPLTPSMDMRSVTRAGLMPVSTGAIHQADASTGRFSTIRSAPLHAYKTVFAKDVLDGKVAPDLFAGQVVLMGVGASGLMDARALMRSGPVLMGAGIEDSADIADAFLHANPYVHIDAWQNALYTATITALMLTALWLRPARAFGVCVCILFVGLGISYLVWRAAGVWVAPGALLLVGAPVFAVSTRRLSWRMLPYGATSLVPMMAARLHAGEAMVPRSPLSGMVGNGLGRSGLGADGSAATNGSTAGPCPAGASANRRSRGEALPADTEDHRKLQSLRDILMAAIESLPDIILVCQGSGRVVIGNLAAARYFGLASDALQEQTLARLLAGLSLADGSKWEEADGQIDVAKYLHGVECRDDKGAEFLLKCAPCTTRPAEGEAWIVSLVDVAALHEAERRRDDAMRFLSHDMRSPLTAILALLTLNREDATELPPAEMLSRIRRLASRSLVLAETFVQLARAEPPAHEREPVDLADIVMDAADDCWSQAQSKRITIDVDVPPNAALSLGDRELVRRAVINLVNNAVKYSPRSSRVLCAVYLVDDDWCVAIRDEGRGIAFEDRELLFKKFVRLGECEPDAEPGVGLGLAFTKTVVDRHGGRIEVDSVLGVGSEFRLYLKAMG